MGRNGLGLQVPRCRELVSPHVAFAYGGLPALRVKEWMASLDQRAAAHAGDAAAVRGAEAHDRGAVAQRICGLLICPAPAARGIRGVGGGEKRRLERALLVPHSVVLRALRGAAEPGAVLAGGDGILPGPDVQADDGHAAVCAAAAGLVASSPSQPAGDSLGKDTAVCTGSR